MPSPAPSLLIRSGAAITDTSMPVVRRHPMINSGTLACYRFNRPDCIDMSGGLADGMAVQDLAGKVSGSLVLPNGNNLIPYNGNAGIQLASGLGRVRLEEGGKLFQGNPLGHDLLIMAWARFPVVGTGVQGGIFGREIAYPNLAPDGPFFVYQYPTVAGNDGIVAGKFASDTGNGVVQTGRPTPAGLRHIAMARMESTGQIVIYIDGVQTISQAIGGRALNANAAPMVFGQTLTAWAPLGLVMHSWYAEDLTISGASLATRVALDAASGADFA